MNAFALRAAPQGDRLPARKPASRDFSARTQTRARRGGAYALAPHRENRPLQDKAASSGSVVRNDPLNNTDPRGMDTWALGWEVDWIPTEGKSFGGGVFVNFDEGRITVGTYSTDTSGAGWDVGAGAALSVTEGTVADFRGYSETVEVDIPVPGLSVESGMTEGGRRTSSVEFGVSLPTGPLNVAGSYRNNEATASESGSVVPEEAAAEAGQQINDAPDRIRDSIPIPRREEPWERD